MARARNIKPGFFKNEDLAECSPWARLCFIGLWMLADREGRLEDRPKRIKGELFPYESFDAEPLLQELARYGFIERYEVDGVRVIAIPKFADHQTPHIKEKPSELPDKHGTCTGLSPDASVKNDANAPSYADETPDKHEASTRLAPDKPRKGSCQHPLNPESLILNPESTTSEPIGSGTAGAAPPGDFGAGMTAQEAVWADGVPLLMAAGQQERQARSFLGLKVKAHGAQAVHDVILRCAGHQPVEPVAWMTAALGKAPERPSAVPEPVAWWADAGFPDPYQAENAGCTRHNAHRWRDGQRVEMRA